MKEINLKSYGKINLSLDVTGVRDDGYHSLESVMQRISLFDRIKITWEPSDDSQVSIKVETNKSYLPTDERNLAYKAAQIMAEHYGEKSGGGLVSIYITKNLPVAAGLAGGSGNGAAVLIGLNRLWNLGLSTRALCRLGELLGSDVPFCVLVQNTHYDASLAEGRGEILTPIKKPMKKHLVLAKPAFGVSTKEVYQGIDNYDIELRPDSQALIGGLKSKDYELVYRNMVNVLELYTLDNYEPVAKLKKLFEEKTAAEKVLMSGSGPTVFAVYDSEIAARKACEVMRNMRYEAYWANTVGR